MQLNKIIFFIIGFLFTINSYAGKGGSFVAGAVTGAVVASAMSSGNSQKSPDTKLMSTTSNNTIICEYRDVNQCEDYYKCPNESAFRREEGFGHCLPARLRIYMTVEQLVEFSGHTTLVKRGFGSLNGKTVHVLEVK
jgi:hypothetical protein